MSLVLKGSFPSKIYHSKCLPVTLKPTIAEAPKGIFGPVLKFKNFYRLHDNRADVFHGEFISLKFYPSAHFVSLFRKTNPAFTVKSMMSKSFSDNAGSYIKNYYAKQKSAVPSNYAVWRRKVKLLVQDPFFEEWTNLDGRKGVEQNSLINPEEQIPLVESYNRTTPKGMAKDGYYEFLIQKYPDNVQDNIALQNEVRRAVGVVANLDWGKFLNEKLPALRINPKYIHKVVFKKRTPETWVEKANKKLNIAHLNKYLIRSDIPLKLIKLKKKKST
ncbi:similar to Saccharomyces cerevisiae YJL023C PET130 Protein required for respiratory growth [Maudiozyma saulgeensis]|uniref:Similar to Saccharomyces cerevisiae YJL023C PET130 Protein required for respiratory growth n=1 Tax=Maudiozyma saulgeensis TaxID=1789683 RepID=A0A1X7QZ34_9SACH|nr:similar to Saccharomyces cerevisiae YJL023C PET130 Protein required for respiratory growth [Kazachstania saulgeensis]